MQERLELVEKLQQRLRRAETLPEVEAEQAQRVASLSKVLLWVPGVGRCGPGGVACELRYEVGSSVGGDGDHPQPVELPGART